MHKAPAVPCRACSAGCHVPCGLPQKVVLQHPESVHDCTTIAAGLASQAVVAMFADWSDGSLGTDI